MPDLIERIEGVDVVDLPAVDLAAAAVHVGDMAMCDRVTVPALFDWMHDHEMQTAGHTRVTEWCLAPLRYGLGVGHPVGNVGADGID